MKVFIIAGVLMATSTVGAQEINQQVVEARSIVKAFAGELKAHLKPALQQGGPSLGVNVCSDVAPVVADKYSKKTGWKVARTSLKFRNPNNAPDAWQTKVLNDFELKKQQGQSLATMEYSEVVSINGDSYFRYMKAIPTKAKPCLACHGGKINPATAELINKNYPNDLAVGYKAGDIRGAFSLIKAL